LALENECRFVIADDGFIRKLGQRWRRAYRDNVVRLLEAADCLNMETAMAEAS
jgi:hypothetical protein